MAGGWWAGLVRMRAQITMISTGFLPAARPASFALDCDTPPRRRKDLAAQMRQTWAAGQRANIQTARQTGIQTVRQPVRKTVRQRNNKTDRVDRQPV